MLKNTMNIKRYKDLLRITHGQKMFRVPDIHYKKKNNKVEMFSELPIVSLVNFA